MKRSKRCVCCQVLKPKVDFEQGNMCKKCVSFMFTPVPPQIEYIDGDQLALDFD